MAAPPPDAFPIFPDREAFARVLFEEALRHLEDARVLHQSARFPGAITSSMKAAEIGLKSVLVMSGALGWWEKLFTTHTPLNDIAGHPILRREHITLEAHNPQLLSDAKEMEKLTPSRPGAKAFDLEAEANPEYPFLSVGVDVATGRPLARIHRPAHHFGEADSRHYYTTARTVLTALQTLYPDIRAWGLTVPESL